MRDSERTSVTLCESMIETVRRISPEALREQRRQQRASALVHHLRSLDGGSVAPRHP